MKRSLLAITVGLVIIFTAYSFTINQSVKVKEKTSIAVCPTWYSLESKIKNKNGYEIVKTSSTVESLSLLEKGRVDFIISGRPLKPNEPNFQSEKLGEGYLFLSSTGGSITSDNLDNYSFQTDLDKEKIKESFPNIRELKEVENPYENISERILITSFENVDYSQAGLVDILDQFERRVDISRRPTLYFRRKNKEKVEEIKNLIK